MEYRLDQGTTKEIWLKMLNTGEFSLDFFYRYYMLNRDESKKIIEPDTFLNAFNQWFPFFKESVIRHFNSIFEVTVLENKRGEVIQYL